METIKKYWAQITFLLSLLGAAVVWVANIDTRTFDSAEQKVEHDTYIKNAPSPKDQWRKYYRDSMDNVNAEKSRRKRDSMYEVLIKRMDYNDSIQLLNADQMFQIKEQLKPRNEQ